MKYKYKKFDGFLFRINENERIELFREENGTWTPYDEDDNYDVKMMGMPLDEDRANKWIQSESKQAQPA